MSGQAKKTTVTESKTTERERKEIRTVFKRKTRGVVVWNLCACVGVSGVGEGGGQIGVKPGKAVKDRRKEEAH